MVDFSELKLGWRTLIGLILVYTFGYPPTIVVVMTSLISGNCFNRSLLEPEDKVDFTSYEREKAVIISVFTIFMNSVPLCLNFISTTTRKIAIFATCLQIVGLLLCYLTISNSRIGIILGFGVLVSGGIGLNIVNNITVACRVFPNTLTLACGLALTIICLLGAGIPYLLLHLETVLTELEYNDNEIREYKLLLYLGLTIFGLAGAFLLKTETRRVEEKNRSVSVGWEDIKSLLRDGRFLITAGVNSCCFSTVVYIISLIDDISDIHGLSKAQRSVIETSYLVAHTITLLPVSYLGEILDEYLQYPRKSIYQFFAIQVSVATTLVMLLPNLVTNYNFTITVAFSIITGASSSAMFLTTNLVYVDCFKSKYETAVTLSNLFRGMFALVINPLSTLFDFHIKLYLLSVTMVTGLIFWMSSEFFSKSRELTEVDKESE